MKNTHKFFSKWQIVHNFLLATTILELGIVFMILLVSFAREEYTIKIVLNCSVIIFIGLLLYAYAFYSIYARIEFDFDKKEIYILKFYKPFKFKTRLIFSEIEKIKLYYYSKVKFNIFIFTGRDCLKIRYNKYNASIWYSKKALNNVQLLIDDINKIKECLN